MNSGSLVCRALLCLMALPAGMAGAAGDPATCRLDELDMSHATSGWRTVQPCRSIDDNPLRTGGKSYAFGLGTHAPSQVHIALDGKADRFRAVVGIDDENHPNPAGSVVFVVIGDGKELFRSEVMRLGMAQALDVKLAGVRRLSLIVEDGGDGKLADHADWCEAEILYAGERPRTTSSPPRWSLQPDGSIIWDVAKDPMLPHADHIEISGQGVSVIADYGVAADGTLLLQRHVVWPMLRTLPNDTHASLAHDFKAGDMPGITVDGEPLGAEKPLAVSIAGMLRIRSATASGIEVERTLFPSRKLPVVFEKWSFTNRGGKAVKLEVASATKPFRTDPAKGVDGTYLLETRISGGGKTLAPGETHTIHVGIDARREREEWPGFDAVAEETARRDYVHGMAERLRLETPDPVIDRLFRSAKLRAAESIYATKGGLMHGPGGGKYYAAIWANDQAEYVNPFFPFLGDEAGNESALNAFRHFARFMRDDFRPVVSSVIAEGDSYWNGAGDRGDAAMIAYGASRYALARGDRAIANEVWPWIEWCLEYCHRKTTAEGVIASKTDELEGRFPAGSANLCTSTLAYDALVSASLLGKELGKPEKLVASYRERAKALREAIERHFGTKLDGYETYRYYDGNTTLRAWIAIPLTVGILERAPGTLDALFSPRLWTRDGLATESGKETFWDRATLYGLRGAFAAGDTKRALDFLGAYSQRRLLGEHVPYPVEAYPENNQRHLSAESGLYCRVITEGLFGIRPTGLASFTCNPRLPAGWDRMALRSIRAFGRDFDLLVTRPGPGRRIVTVTCGGKQILVKESAEGETLAVTLP